MKQLVWAGLALAVAAGCQREQAPPATNVGAPEERADRPGEGPALLTVGGQIAQVDEETLVVETSLGARVEMQIDPEAQILFEGRPLDPAELQEGDSVRAAYREIGQERIARRIDVDAVAGEPQSPSTIPGTTGMQAADPEPVGETEPGFLDRTVEQPGLQQQPGTQEPGPIEPAPGPEAQQNGGGQQTR